MFAGIMALIQALPELLKLLNRLGDVAQSLAEVAREKNLNKWIDDLEMNINDLKKAQTPQQKLDAASGLVDRIRAL